MKMLALMMTVLLAGPCLALEIEKIRELANTDHDPEGLIPELKMFVNGREFDVTITMGAPGGESKTSPVVKTYDKVVKQRYLVSQYRPPAAAAPIISVLSYEDSAEVYRKWTLMPDNVLHVSVGTALPDAGAVSWIRLGTPDSQVGFVMAVEKHTADGVTWREVTFTKKGQVSFIVNGKANKTK